MAMMGRRREESLYQANVYVMGSDDPELRRLQTISVLYRDITRRWLEHAGISPGMSVVDVGCGPGDVTLLAGFGRAARVGVDGAHEALARARSRADERDFAMCATRNRRRLGADCQDRTVDGASDGSSQHLRNRQRQCH